ncbi:MAG: CpsD/CapB family tyrosine-protein kinase [Chakrabartia sp.]
MTMLAQPDPHSLTRRTSALMIVDPMSLKAEAIRGLRTRLIAQHIREGRRGLALCAAAEGTGCTYVATNLAVAMAQVGVKTVLIDTNLRGGGVAPVFDCPAEAPGLGDFLADATLRPRDIMEVDIIPDLTIVPSGPACDNAQELLSSQRFLTFVGQMMREHDFALFDTTPANRCTDAQRVATLVGHSLIIARRDQTYFNDVKMLARLLRADKSSVVGTVLNDF